MSCLACGAAGPTAETDDGAREAWAELVEFVEVLALWNAGAEGNAEAAFRVDLAAERQCGHPCREYFASGACACTELTRELAAAAIAKQFVALA